MRLSFTVRAAGSNHGTFDAWCENGQQYASLSTRRGVTQVSYPNPVTGDPWLFIPRALHDLEVQRLRDRVEVLETIVAKGIHQ